MNAGSPPARPDRRVAFGEGWVLLGGMAAAGTAVLGMWIKGSGGSWRVLLGIGAVLLFVRFAIAPAAAAFTRALHRRRTR